MSLSIGSLFSGIGGLELGLERAGLGPVVWQVEREPYCRAVLAKHWPDAVRHDDVCTVGADTLESVDVICGGFPCQDVSTANKHAQGLEGDRSGLWFEYARVVRELRPRYVVVENVAALLARGLDRVLGSLAALGYDAEWSTVSACAVGAPHMRARVFLVAYANGVGLQGGQENGAHRERHRRRTEQLSGLLRPSAWPRLSESEAGGVAHGFPARVERTVALGNSVAPAVAEVAGRLIVAREAARATEAA